MRKNKALLTLFGTSVLLFSCAVSLSRDEATELLDKIVLRVSEGDFEVPETYSYSEHVTYTESSPREVDINYSYAKTSKYHYMHCKTITKLGSKDVSDSSGASYKVTETETLDEYYYLDPAATEKTFITYISRELDWVSDESVSLPKAHDKEIIEFKEVIGETALSSWETKMSENMGDRYSKNILKVAEECDEFLKSLYSNHDIYVKDSKYESLGEGNLDMFVVTYGHGEEKSVTAVFDQYLVKRYDIRNPSMIKTSTYNWNNVKYIYPDLADARSETDSGSTSSIAQLS